MPQRPDEIVIHLSHRVFFLLPAELRAEQLLLQVWNAGVHPDSNVVDVFVRTLRGKIGPDRIRTVRGLGYRLEVRS